MVDSISSTGNIQALNNNKAESKLEHKKDAASSHGRVIEDSVEISENALNAAAAEKAAIDIAKSLKENSYISLSGDPFAFNEDV
jgi:hypothetical protein